MALKYYGPTATLPDGTRNPLTHAVRAGDFVFFSGLMPKDEKGQLVGGPIEEQTECVMNRLARILKSADCTFDDLVKVTVWLTHAEDFPAFNKVYKSFFPNNVPARSAVRCDLLLQTVRIEIEVIAYKPEKA